MNAFYPSPNGSPLIMGILNVTPDSFSDGQRYLKPMAAIEKARQMVDQGADIIDIGGESTRPGAKLVSSQQEIDRVIPVIEQMIALKTPISIDTSKPLVMQAAVQAGACMINDVRALQKEGALTMAAALKVPVCLMHMQGKPSNMQQQPQYEDVVQQVIDFLQDRVFACQQAGIATHLISIDPGFGFGKTLEHNKVLLNRLDELSVLAKPVLVGLSRKSMLGEMTGQAVDQRLAASLAVAQVALQKGALILRVHDVAATNDLRKVFLALKVGERAKTD